MSETSQDSAASTRKRLLNSFNSLVLNGAQGKITVSDVVREAGLGRSTFYDHYASAEDIHQQALAGPLTTLADSILGLENREHLAKILAHFWEYRQRARLTLSGEEGEKAEHLLFSILNARLRTGIGQQQDSTTIAAIELAVVPLALIRAWLTGKVQCTSEELADHILKAGAAMRRELPRFLD